MIVFNFFYPYTVLVVNVYFFIIVIVFKLWFPVSVIHFVDTRRFFI